MSSSINNPQPNLKSGTVYKKISDFLGNNPTLDADPTPIKSNNTITNPYTNKKKRRYVDMIGDTLPPSLHTKITAKCYNKLRKLEHEMDISLSKRHSLISTQLQQTNNTTYSHNITRLLRFELFNTFHLNPQDENQNKFTFKLQTKLFNPKNMSQPINPSNNRLEYYYYHPLQALISRIQIKLENHNDIVWNNPNWSFHDKNASFLAKNDTQLQNTLMDGLQIERYGNKNCRMDIFIYLINWFIPFENTTKKQPIHANHNAICKVSKALSLLLGLGVLSHANGAAKGYERYDTKCEILQCLGYYVRSHNLLRNDHSMAIDCNKDLEKIMGLKTIYSANLWKVLVLKKHILPPDPIHIQHEICVTGKIEENAKIYDVLVRVPSLVAMKASKLMEGSRDLYGVDNGDGDGNYALRVDALNVQISDVLEEINEERKQKELYEEYGADPVSSIDVMVSNQRENLQIIQEFCANANVKASQYFADSSVYDDIKRYLKKDKLIKNESDNSNN